MTCVISEKNHNFLGIYYNSKEIEGILRLFFQTKSCVISVFYMFCNVVGQQPNWPLGYATDGTNKK